MRRHPNAPGTAEKVAALSERFHEGQFTETVYRASIFALGFRGDAIDEIVKPELEKAYARHRPSSTHPASEK